MDMNGLLVTLWLIGLGVLGGSKPGAAWLERAECHLRSVPRLLGAKASVSPGHRDCPCGEVCDDDAKDVDVKDVDTDDHDVCDGCDPDEEEEREAE